MGQRDKNEAVVEEVEEVVEVVIETEEERGTEVDETETTFSFDDAEAVETVEETEDEEVLPGVEAYMTADELGELAGRGINLGTDVAKALRSLTAALLESRERIKENATLVEVGRRHRELAIDEAMRSGVRALGDAFDPERYRRILDGMTYDDIRYTQETFEAQVAEKFNRTPPVSLTAVEDGEKPTKGVRSRSRHKVS